MRRTWLRGRENVHKRYFLQVAWHNLSLLMRRLIGAGTPKQAAERRNAPILLLLTPDGAVVMVMIAEAAAARPDRESDFVALILVHTDG